MSGHASGRDASPSSRGSLRELLLFGKVPLPGGAKTRLAPALGEEGAARLYRAFLDDTVALARSVEVERRGLWLAGPAEGRRRLSERHPELTVRAQRGEDLGTRMARAIGDAFRRGAGRIVVVGTDHPTLPPARLRRAFRLLASADLVLGPTDDGGYYALGLRREAWPEGRDLFGDVPWSTERVLASTRSRADRAGLSRRELRGWYDVDRPEELARLRRDASPDSRSAAVLRSLESGE